LKPTDQIHLARMIACIYYHQVGDVIGLMRQRVGLKSRLRLLASINPFFYYFRRRFYGLFSGW